MSRSRASFFYEVLANKSDLHDFIQRRRDLVILEIINDFLLVIACDSNASIGLKEHDYVRHSFKEVGRSASKVPLMEVIAAGASPFVVIDNLCVEPEPAGAGILEGIRYEVERLGLDPDLVITGSKSLTGDLIVCAGIPKNAPKLPYLEDDPEIMDPVTVCELRSYSFIHDMIPVGSHGVKFEMEILAKDSNCIVDVIPSEIDLYQSAGASTCVLASLAEKDYPLLLDKFSRPVAKVGFLREHG
jgi:hypothetical protein